VWLRRRRKTFHANYTRHFRSLTPAQTAIDQGQTLNYTASVTNDSKNMGVAWSMSGTACTGTGCGTFTNGTTSAAVYDAPASVTAKMTVSITATSVADKTKSVSSAVVVTPARASRRHRSRAAPWAPPTAPHCRAAVAPDSHLEPGVWLIVACRSFTEQCGSDFRHAQRYGEFNLYCKVTDASGAQGGPLSTTQQLSIAINAPPL